jgi:hypothetical protein
LYDVMAEKKWLNTSAIHVRINGLVVGLFRFNDSKNGRQPTFS